MPPKSIDIHLVKEKVALYQQALADIQVKRALWTSTTKSLIYAVLKKVKRVEKLAWKVEKYEESNFLEAISLNFEDMPSGIMIEVAIEGQPDKTIQQEATKYGGSLAFSQTYNGDILIIILYPYIDGEMAERVSSVLERVAPELINEKFVLEQVAFFLEQMTQWETSITKPHIGFKIDRQA